jgi:hypothetical protein
LVPKPLVKESIKKAEYEIGGYYNKLGGIGL